MQMIRSIATRASEFFGGDSLRAQAVRGGAWLGVGSVVEQIFRFGRNFILTRLIAPDAFGEIALVSSTAALLQGFADLGIREALIQDPNGERGEYVNAAWWLSFGRGLALAALVFLGAPLVAHLYGKPQLGSLFRMISIAIIADGATSARAITATREMKLQKLALITNGGNILGVVATVIVAYMVRDARALVFALCLETGFRCLVSYWILPFIPSFKWDRRAFGDLVHFSRGLVGLSFLNFIFGRADITVLGFLMTDRELGIYSLGINLIQTPLSFVMRTLGGTLLPTLASVREDNGRFNRVLTRVESLILLAGLPFIALIAMTGSALLQLAYGEAYKTAGFSLLLATVVAVINLMNAQITTALFAKGQPQIHRVSVAIMAVSVLALIYPLGWEWKGDGGQMACLVAVGIGFLYQIYKAQRLTGLTNLVTPGTLLTASLSALGVLGAGWFAKSIPALDAPIPTIAVCAVACGAACLVTLYTATFSAVRKEDAIPQQGDASLGL